MKHSIQSILLAAMALAGTSAHAQGMSPEMKAVAQSLQALPNFPAVQEIRPLPQSDGALLEVVAEKGQIFYTDPKGKVLIIGPALEVPSAKNLTQERLNEIAKIDWGKLPLQDSFVEKKGAGERKMAVFTDPSCPYCKRLEDELAKIDNVTIHYFPVSFLGANSEELNRNILCSANPTQAYHAWMKGGAQPLAAAQDCTPQAPARNTAFANANHIGGTPTLYFEDGSRIGGLAPAEEIEKKLAQAKKP